MKFRNLNQAGDWTFGKGLGNYVLDASAVAVNVQTRLYEFLNDCFFDAARGIDWFNILGTNNEAELLFSVRGKILDTEGVQSVTQLGVTRDENRQLVVNYTLTTTFGDTINARLLPAPVTPFSGISKFVGTFTLTDTFTYDVDVSSNIDNARNAIWQVYDVSSGYTEIVGVVQPLNETTVRITMVPNFTGTIQLVGIA